jgi:hypothetical protein
MQISKKLDAVYISFHKASTHLDYAFEELDDAVPEEIVAEIQSAQVKIDELRFAVGLAAEIAKAVDRSGSLAAYSLTALAIATHAVRRGLCDPVGEIEEKEEAL